MMHVVTPVKSASASDSPQLLISIDGNIGIGKSTLMRELKDR